MLRSILFYTLIGFSFAFAQERTVYGIVVDSSDYEPLKGANVYLKNHRVGAMTDQDGYFRFEISGLQLQDTLVVNFLGYNMQYLPLAEFVAGKTIRLSSRILTTQEKITVLADRIDISRQEIPHARSEISLEQIERMGSGEIGDIFKTDPTVRVVGNDLDGRQIQIRGSDADEVNVYIDGILINSLGFDNASDISLIPTESIKKVEVLKGANLILLGNGAFGGVVNFTTRKEFKNSYAVKGKFGSSRSRYIAVETNLPLTDKILLNYFGQVNTLTPEIEYFQGEQFEEKTVNSLIKTSKQNHHISLDYISDQGHLSNKIIGYFLNYRKPFWQNRRSNLLAASNYRGSIFGWNDFDLSANYLFSDDRIGRTVNNRVKYNYNFKTQRLNIRAGKKFSSKSITPRLEFQLLTEYLHDELVNETELEQGSDKTTLYNTFLYDNRASAAGVLSFSDTADSLAVLSWTIYAGIRGDFLAGGEEFKTNTYGFQLNIRRANWQLSPYISFGENLKFPTLLEKAYLTDVRDLSLAAVRNENLKIRPEFTTAGETGFTFSFQPERSFYRNLEIRFAAFSNNIDNKLTQRPLEGILVRTQTGSNRTQGYELSVQMNRFLGNFDAQVAWTELEISDPLLYPYKPERSYSLGFDYAGAGGFSAGILDANYIP